MHAKDLLHMQIHMKGKIQRVLYKSANYDDGDFAIIKFSGNVIDGQIPEEFMTEEYNYGHSFIFSGATPSLKTTAEYEIIGELVKHDKYGYRYNITRMIEDFHLTTKKDIEKFFTYVFPETITKNIMETFDNPLQVLESGDISTLTKVHGVGVKTAMRIIKKYRDSRIDMQAYVELYNYGLTKHMIEKLCAIYGSPTTLIKKIKENPYNLIYDVKGVGWIKADGIALTGGLDPNDPRRIQAYMFYLLQQDANINGNTCMNVQDLLTYCYEYFPDVDKNQIGVLMIEMVKEGHFHINKKTREVGLNEYYVLEEKIAKELYRIIKAPVKTIKNIDATIAECEINKGITYSDEQRIAINNCLTQNISIVTALGGSGKTSSMYPVSRAIRENGQYAALCALSGKASSNLGEITELEGKTIHRLLGYNPNQEGYIHHKNNPLTYDMVILDEASMVDAQIFCDLLEAIPNGCKLVLVGDTGQLEPIGVGCIFHDMIQSKKFSHIHLTKIFRQAQKSGVITESRKVYDEKQIVKPNFYGTEIRGELQDFKIITTDTAESVLCSVLKEYKRMLSEYNASPNDITVVVGKRAIGDTSARKINECIQKIVNPDQYEDQVSIKKRDGNVDYIITFKPGDKVRVTKNNYKTVNVDGVCTPIFNGNIGVIQHVQDEGMIVRFQQGDVIISDIQFEDLELGYAITCHSAQGSGFPYVIAVCDNGSYPLLSKEWLYTAITRCKTFCTLIGQPSAIRRACSVTSIKYKQTWLKNMIVKLWETDGRIVEEE